MTRKTAKRRLGSDTKHRSVQRPAISAPGATAPRRTTRQNRSMPHAPPLHPGGPGAAAAAMAGRAP